jgi:hypothetical protein
LDASCAICGCLIHHGGEYATPTVNGRSHATKHHFVAERFFGRSNNRKGTQREGIFAVCPWALEGKTEEFCYECHEELLHNPVFLPADIQGLRDLVKFRGFSEQEKPATRTKLAGRIELLNEIIARGIETLIKDEQKGIGHLQG